MILGTALVGVPEALGVPSSQVRSFEAVEDLLRALRADELEACLLPLVEAVLASRTDEALLIGVALGESATLAWGVRKEDGMLRSRLDEYLTNVRRSGTWARLVVKYFGERALEVVGR